MIRRAYQVFAATAVAGLFAACSATTGEQERAATGSDEADQAAQTVRYADQNRDGKVTRDEAEADKALSASFERYDANDNGELDRAEFARLEAESARRQNGDRHQLRPRNEYPRDLD